MRRSSTKQVAARVAARVVFVLACVSALGGACRKPPPAAPGLSTVAGSEGLVIDPDGTVYFSQGEAVGRLTPAGALDKDWAMLPGATTVWGLALDGAARALYAGSPTTKTVYKITLGDAPAVTSLVTNAGAPNGLTMGPDGALYYSDFAAAGDIYRVTADGARAKVTTTPLDHPNGLAFGPDGALYVDLFELGAVTKLGLAAGTETARAPLLAAGTVEAADGLAFDADGNLYIGFGGGVMRASPDGESLTKLSKGRTANVEFGAGAIPSNDLYAVTNGKIVHITNGAAGATVPWHVPGK